MDTMQADTDAGLIAWLEQHPEELTILLVAL
jgi:hypothetical protein